MNFTKVIFYLLLIAAIVSGVYFYSRVFGYIAMAMVLSYLLDPLVSWVERRHLPRWMAVLCVYLGILGVLAWLSLGFVPDLVRQGRGLIDIMQTNTPGGENLLVTLPFLRDVYQLLLNLDKQLPNLDLAAQFLTFLASAQTFLTTLPQTILDNYSEIIGAVSYVGTVPLISFFLLKDKVLFRKAMVAAASNRYFELVIIFMNKIDETVGRYMRAMLLEVIAVSIMVSIALTAIGVPNAVLIGVVAGVANIIPYFGPFMGAGVAILTVLVNGSPSIMILWVALTMYLVQVIDNNIVYPVVVGTTINMHPLIVLLTVLAGGWFGGILWMLISVPLVYICYSMLRVIYVNLREFRLL
ncbi:MAG TPA: AI-2E family transporter [Candidatus Cloacimonadota bacterium]|mgnify:FL=1|nr:AI-2E family transporter [Candidatus Cloacimonadota bacterium]HOH78589.1 AI-2E family transporter [Candidatus Cloacimonadota bacterium]